MIDSLPEEFASIAATCGICHDQCAAACPVVESGYGLSAYPSRLAMLAWELSRGTIPMDRTVMAAMQQCIHCRACTAHCVYIDRPVDITPLVRWGRHRLIENGWATEAMQALAAQVEANNDSSGELHNLLRELADSASSGSRFPETALLLVNAAALKIAPEMVKSALRLLAAYTRRTILLSSYLDCAGSLYEYGYTAEARIWAGRLADEAARFVVGEVITLTAADAHLLRQVYPAALGITIPVRVRTLTEVLRHALEPERLRRNDRERVLLVRSMTEVYKMPGSSPLEILRACCTVANDPIPDHLFLRDLAYPDGLALDLNPDPRSRIMERILRYAEAMHATRIVTTEPSFLPDYQQQSHSVPAVDFYSYILESIA